MGSEQHAREVMRDVDTNQDGVISIDEFRAMMRSVGAGSLESSSIGSLMSLASGAASPGGGGGSS